MSMPATMRREWAKQEVADALRSWLKDRLESIPLVDERDALTKQVVIALKAIGYTL